MLHRLPVGWTTRKIQLLVASYLFYAAYNPPSVLLLWISTVTDWYAARWIRKAEKPSARRFFLILSLSANLGLLGVFKYGGFLLENFVWLMSLLNVEFEPQKPNIVLPVGISFYTFQSLSYTLAVYRKKLEPWPSFLDFAMFVTFFPQLVAGPIVRAADFLPQCTKLRQATFRQIAWGLSLLVSGLFQKVVLADALLALVGDRVFDSAVEAGTVDAWIGILAFSSQIFFDFNGYSSCAIGSALCLGFVLPDNFRFPYGAIGFRDFWRRWHISLSTWLKDYVYVSLGGNKKGCARTLANIILTMLIGGLWHGTSWRYVIWGGMHGALLLCERLIAERFGGVAFFKNTAGRLVLALTTYALLCVTWPFSGGPI